MILIALTFFANFTATKDEKYFSKYLEKKKEQKETERNK